MQRALLAPVAADIDVAKKPEMRYTALKDQCSPCCGLVTIRSQNISREVGYLASHHRAAGLI